MSISLYKPNKANTGFAFSFSQGLDKKSQEPVLYMRAISQYSWDDSRRLGGFSENREVAEKNISLKFNEFECGAIISCLSHRNVYEAFHKFGENQTIIRFTPWDKNNKIKKIDPKTKEYKESYQVIPAFGVSVTRNGNQTFKMSLEPGEVECLRIFIGHILENIYSSRLAKMERSYEQSKEEPSDPASAPF